MSHATSASSDDRLVPFFTAIVAVLAALGTLFSHHRSITALSVRNQALVLTAQASDQYTYYQTKQLKVTLYQALLASSASGGTARASTLHQQMEDEQRSSLAVFARAKVLEGQAAAEQQRAENLLHSFETLEIATTLFEISIAFASIAALTHARMTVWAGVVLSAFGVVLAVTGYLQAH